MLTARALLVVAVAILFALLPASAAAQTNEDDDDVLIRINADIRIAAGDVVGTLIVIDGDAFVAGTVEHDVVVINGDLSVSGTVGDDITVIDGDVILLQPAEVNDVRTIAGDIEQSPGATVTGNIRERDNFDALFGTIAVLSLIYLWIAMTIVFVVSGLVLAMVAGRQAVRAATVMTSQLVNTIVGAVVFWIGVPIVAGIIIATLVGIPLGLGIFFFVIPLVWFAGYLVAGARLGRAILGRYGREPAERPLAATTLGLIILQIIMLVPVLGWLIAGFAGVWGAGAVVYAAYSAAGGKSFGGEPPAAAAAETSAA